MSVRNENTTEFFFWKGHSSDMVDLRTSQVTVIFYYKWRSHIAASFQVMNSWYFIPGLYFHSFYTLHGLLEKKDCLLTFLQFYSIHGDIKCSCHKPHAKIATFFESKFISNLKIAVQRLLDFCGRGQLLEWILQQTRGKNCYFRGISLARYRISWSCPLSIAVPTG